MGQGLVKVALLTGRYGSGTGTAGVAERLARGLAAAGVDVVVHTDRVDGRADVPILPLGERATAAGRVEPGRIRLALDRVPGCELVRASGGVHRAWLRADVGGGLRRVRDLRADRAEADLERRALRGARIVVANAARVAGEVAAWHGVPLERIRVVRTGVDLERFRPDPARARAIRSSLGVPPSGRVALFLGHGFRRKNLVTAIAAFQAVAGEHDRLLVVGRDRAPGRFVGADRRVLLLGARPADQVWPAAAALLLPTRYEAASNATLEALACGVPPCVPIADGAAELVPDRRLVVRSPEDVKGFADALRYAWGEPTLPARCRAAAEQWPVPRMVRELVELVVAESGNG